MMRSARASVSRKAGQLQHGRDVRLILGAHLLHVLVVGEVVLAVGKLQAALQQVGGVMIGIVEAGRDPQSEQVRGVEVGVVQGVDVGAQCLAQRVRQFFLVVDRGDRLQVRLQRRRAPWPSMAASSM